jgi:hypothetical protein
MHPKNINGVDYCYKTITKISFLRDSYTSKSYGRCKPNINNVKCRNRNCVKKLDKMKQPQIEAESMLKDHKNKAKTTIFKRFIGKLTQNQGILTQT